MTRIKEKCFVALAVFVSSLLFHLATAQLYVAEGYFVIDDETVQMYIREIPGSASPATKRAQAVAELNKDIIYILTEVNALLGSLAMNGLNVEVRIKKLDILSTNIIPPSSILPGTENVVEPSDAIKTFDNWLVAQNSYNNIHYDFAQYWTGYKLKDFDGWTYLGTICQPKDADHIEVFDGTYWTALGTAHQICKLLGSQHSTHTDNRWFLPSSIASDIRNKMASLSPNCLLQTDPASSKPFIEFSDYTGRILNPDVTCQRYLNYSNSYMCKGWHLYDNLPTGGDRVCSTISCSGRDENYCDEYETPEGMICDPGKRCRHGSCVEDLHTPTNIDPSCVFGDEVRTVYGNYTGPCSDLIIMYGPQVCYDSFISQVCCTSCKAHHTGRTGCEYGDRDNNCHTYSHSLCSNVYYQNVCCDYCLSVNGKRWLEPGN
ncbi:uncharacterized protein LOC106062265 isoform X3 [Biomphalaria glabrata]|nr:uncharacterized protein LOC106062265 isoform X3 [Biomphalaria glabrata]